ncbi:MAG: TetR/AcrR family transcriptional regulator [Saprospiraceae bacterium]|nr:TetR/AcrR family transcriptional regulator [Saprospiraceae bacterium]
MKDGKKNQKKRSIIYSRCGKVFNKVGFKNAKMEDIAKRADITKVTLYTYFPI